MFGKGFHLHIQSTYDWLANNSNMHQPATGHSLF